MRRARPKDGPARGRWRDRRLWLGLLITGLTLWLALRDVSFASVARDMARADLPLLLGLSIPAYLAILYVRALRWRHLTDAVCPIGRGALFRATSIGFLVNNVFPLRLGELVRAWYLGREVGAPGAAIFGTVILERVIDSVVIVGLAILLLGFRGSQAGGGSAVAVGLPLVLVAALPVALVVMLRTSPERSIRLLRRVLAVSLPARFAAGLEGLLRRIVTGFGSLQGGRHLLWIALHSAVLWVILAVVPFLAAILALDIQLGSPARTLAASYVTVVAVGVAVAIPSAPGFFGPYHLACREALSRFGVPEELALALGTLAHAVFWITVNAIGLLALRGRGRDLEELTRGVQEPGKESPAHRR